MEKRLFPSTVKKEKYFFYHVNSCSSKIQDLPTIQARIFLSCQSGKKGKREPVVKWRRCLETINENETTRASNGFALPQKSRPDHLF